MQPRLWRFKYTITCSVSIFCLQLRGHTIPTEWTSMPSPSPHQQMKKSLTSCFGAEIRQLSQPDLPEAVYKRKLKDIHTSFVSNNITQMQPNKVLNAAPPPINGSEKLLPRSSRATLSQLRSGYGKILNSYKARSNNDIQDTWPLCNKNQHTYDSAPFQLSCQQNRLDHQRSLVHTQGSSQIPESGKNWFWLIWMSRRRATRRRSHYTI